MRLRADARSYLFWLVPAAILLAGAAVSVVAYWAAETADWRRINQTLELRSEWRARDFEANVRLAGNATENIAAAIAADAPLDPARFDMIATQARHQLAHVNALQWAPRVRADEIPSFEAMARELGQTHYTVFDVDEDFQPTQLTPRPEYYPVLFDIRFQGGRGTLGLALGRFDGRRIPMEEARDTGNPVATLPVRPIGPPTNNLVYLLFWPVYSTTEVPDTEEARRSGFRGYAVGNYNVVVLLTEALRDTPGPIGGIRITIAGEQLSNAAASAQVQYSPETREIEPATAPADGPDGVRIAHRFDVFDQHWELTFDYSGAAIADLRSRAGWGWLLAGLLLTATLTTYVILQRGREARTAALVRERTSELKESESRSRQTEEQLRQAQKMEAIGNLTGGMAHDFNNLLAIVIGNLDILVDRRKDDADVKELGGEALDAALRGADLTQRLLAFARRQPLQPRPVDLNALITELTQLLRRTLGENVEISLDLDPALWPTVVDPSQLDAALTNLATNARDAMPNGGSLIVVTGNRRLDEDYTAQHADVFPGEYAMIEVSDTGDGMPPELVQRVFEPFFTTKEEGKGTGLGLSMVYGFIRQSGGHINVYSEPGIGTTFRLYLPRREPAGTAGAATTATDAVAGRGESVLAVEDNASLRRVVVRQLRELGYRVTEAENAAAAMKVLEREPVDLLFTDVIMTGGASGIDLAREALARWPDLKVLVTSGFPETKLNGNGRAAIPARLLNKPFRKEDLARAIREALEA